MRATYARVLPLVGTVLAVAALVLGASLVQGLSQTRRDTLPAARAAHDPALDVDLGTVTGSQEVAGCLTRGFATDPAAVQVLYGVQQRRPGGDGPVFVLRNRSGQVRLCDEDGPEPPSRSPLPTVSVARPVAYLSNGRVSWTCAGSTRVLERLQMTGWLLVSRDVATVAVRYWVDGRPGTWFVTRTQRGFAHLQSWVAGPRPAGTTFDVQYKVLDASGSVVPQDVLPTGRQALPGCTAGSTTIG